MFFISDWYILPVAFILDLILGDPLLFLTLFAGWEI